MSDPTDAPKIDTQAPERIWADANFWPMVNVGNIDECWLWTGTKLGRGYGSVRPEGSKTPTGAHRVSWAMDNGRWPSSGEVVMHRCDNPLCVNPKHLRIGSQSENIRDCVAKGRHVPFIPAPKTHCPSGHEYTPENTGYVVSNGRRTKRCLECKREINRQWRARHAGNL